MKKLLGQFFGKKRGSADTDSREEVFGGVGLVFAPGPDRGLYVKGIVKGSPAWEENCAYNRIYLGPEHAEDGSDGAIRIGDCLLDVQEVIDRSNRKARGKKHDVFAKPEAHVTSLLRGMHHPDVELSFRRITQSGDSTLVSVMLRRSRLEIDTINEAERRSKEAERAIAEVRQRIAMERMTEADLRFAEIDEDGSGSVTLDELLRFLQASVPIAHRNRRTLAAASSCSRKITPWRARGKDGSVLPLYRSVHSCRAACSHRAAQQQHQRMPARQPRYHPFPTGHFRHKWSKFARNSTIFVKFPRPPRVRRTAPGRSAGPKWSNSVKFDQFKNLTSLTLRRQNNPMEGQTRSPWEISRTHCWLNLTSLTI